MSGQASTVYFGLNPMWVSTVILAVTYAIIMTEKINRAIIALIGACVMILVGVFSQEEAIKGIDWNTMMTDMPGVFAGTRSIDTPSVLPSEVRASTT